MVAAEQGLARLLQARGEGEPWSLWSLALARGVHEALQGQSVFDEVVALIAQEVRQLGAAAVQGVSPDGSRLAAAVAEVANLPTISGGASKSGLVVLIDSVVNTGIQLDSARENARIIGTDVVAIAVVVQRDVIDAWESQGHRLMALNVV
jgi:hypothetical protein